MPNVYMYSVSKPSMNESETISIVSAQDDSDPSFFSTPIGYVPSRDLKMERHLMFDHIGRHCIRNPITCSDDAETPSIYDILLDHLKSKNAWNEAIQVQMRIYNQNKAHLMKKYDQIRTRFQQALIVNQMNEFTTFNEEQSSIYEKSLLTIRESTFLNEFYTHNRDILVQEHESDADEPFNIFHIKLPVWCYNGNQREHIVKWTSLEYVLRVYISDSVNPQIPGSDFCPIRYIRKIFNNRVISQRMNTQRRDRRSHSLQHIINCIRNKVKIVNRNHIIGIYVRDNTSQHQHYQIGKIRYTLGMILRWLELTHFCVFRDQVSHSILHSFYRNIHTMPVRMIPQIAVHTQNYIHAHVRTLTSENMPEEPEDPVLYIPFEIGMNVYKMACCRKDICSDSIIGILRSGRTPMCPMCRASLITIDSSFPRNPTIAQEDDDVLEYMPEEPMYMRSPLIIIED